MRNHHDFHFAIAATILAFLCGSPRIAAAADCSVKEAIEVALTTTGTADMRITEGCYMPVVTDKTLCGHGIKSEHTFTFTLTNGCAVPVKLKLTVKRGAVDFKDAACDFDQGNVLFEDFVNAGGGSITKTCTSRAHGNGGQKKGRYDVVATAYRVDGNEIAANVKFDPEIILEDNGKSPIVWAIGLLVLAAVGYVLYRALRRA